MNALLEEIVETTEFEKKVSVIVPVYNSEEFLNRTLNSLLSQTIDHDIMEVILIDDGSVDNSYSICREYSDLFSFIHCYTQSNKGVSESRNRGLEIASGEYIMFLDSDDTLSPNSIENVIAFFDENYDETDLVTYPLDTYINGKIQAKHYRFNFLTKSGIYNLEDNIYALQTHMNICIKNTKKHIFDTSMFLHEDQKFISEIISDKMTIGFCQDAKYYYFRNDRGIMGSMLSPLYIFESTIGFYEELYSKYEVVPEYFQSLFVHDLNWKLQLNVLYPYHYEKKHFDEALLRIKNILLKINPRVIIFHPTMDFYHKIYFLKFRNSNVTPVFSEKKISLLCDDIVISQKDTFEVLINSVKINQNRLKIVGSLKSEVFDFSDSYDIFICSKHKNGKISEKKLELFDSGECYYRCKTRTNTFPGFLVDEEISEDSKYYFKLAIEGMIYVASSYYFFEGCSISKEIPLMYGNSFCVSFVENYFFISKISYPAFVERLLENNEFKKENKCLIDVSFDSFEYKQIWLYCDCRNVFADNGLYQFRNDFNKNDGIKRFYINANPENKAVLEGEFGDSVVEFGNIRHKLLFLHADKILTAYIEYKNYNPFTANEYKKVKALVNTEIIYLQHGVLHIDMPWKYSPGRIDADKIVVSTDMERKYLEKNGFNKSDILSVGMARFENTDRNKKHKNRILFAPSWRRYLISEENGEWLPVYDSFVHSTYYEKIQAFLNSRTLINFLEESNIVLDVKLHPIFSVYGNLFEPKSDMINIIGEVTEESDYGLFITDFSSYVYNFVFLQRSIIYFVPDYNEFKSGMSSYWNLTLPFEEGFGKLITDPVKVVTEIKRIIKKGFLPDSKYLKRMNSFFVDFNNCCDDLYNTIRPT